MQDEQSPPRRRCGKNSGRDARLTARRPRSTVLFVHMSKTSGTSMLQGFLGGVAARAAAAGKRLRVAHEEPTPLNLDVLCAAASSTIFVTVLREPVARLVSAFNYEGPGRDKPDHTFDAARWHRWLDLYPKNYYTARSSRGHSLRTGSRRRRGCRVAIPRRRVAATPRDVRSRPVRDVRSRPPRDVRSRSPRDVRSRPPRRLRSASSTASSGRCRGPTPARTTGARSATSARASAGGARRRTRTSPATRATPARSAAGGGFGSGTWSAATGFRTARLLAAPRATGTFAAQICL